MKNISRKLCAVIALCLVHQLSFAAEPRNDGVQRIFGQVEGFAGPTESRQLTDAITASSLLQREINAQVASKRLDGIQVVPRASLEKRKADLFGGFVEGSIIVLTKEYLKELRNSRIYDVEYPDDILPNNTVFVLAHLLFHTGNPLDPGRFNTPWAYSDAAMKTEAAAFIYAWNATMQVAVAANGNKPLSQQQFGQLLLNTRYRFALIGGAGKDFFLPSGYVEMNEKNIQTVVATLSGAQRADLE